ncbi:SRPBCC family protein [Chitiniphilus purpureus]|uniref:SRPBCC family protein n=1 Tax=Chitiniphilus purpureus TaxID=2981137 RepID=A0ABY6DH73_9NEIS|nr:SRPBCC family protein [Chitiniphilus sp. CD1]UXY13666.1 SRPBCC family protein [Chitiniphilus sp. CD1]
MTARTVVHETLTFERSYPVSPARVFAAWSDQEALQRWGSPGADWEVTYERFDFFEGGGDMCRFGPRGGDTYVNTTCYLQIVPERRIVSANTMRSATLQLFAGLVTVEFHPQGTGCRMVLTEQGAYLDGNDRPEDHRAGWDEMLDNLARELAGTPGAS